MPLGHCLIFASVLLSASGPDELELGEVEQAELYGAVKGAATAELSPGDAAQVDGGVLPQLIAIDAIHAQAQVADRLLGELVALRPPRRFVQAYAKALRCMIDVRLGRAEVGAASCREALEFLDSRPAEAAEESFISLRILYANGFLAIRSGRARDSLEFANRALPLAASLESDVLTSHVHNMRPLALHYFG